MKELLKIELKRAFTGIWMKISITIGVMLAVCHFVLRVLPEDILSGYHPDVGNAVPYNLLNGWMAGRITPENEIYIWLVLILVVIPYGTTFYQDKKSGTIKNFYIRQDKKKFLVSKSIATFLSAGVAALVPLITSFALTATVFPVVFPEWHSGPQCKAFFVSIYYENFILYYFLMFLMIFLYAGLVAGLALSISLVANNIFIVMTSPFLICMLISKTVIYSGSDFLYGFQLWRIFDVAQSGAKYPTGQAVMTVLLILFGYITFIVRGIRDDTF